MSLTLGISYATGSESAYIHDGGAQGDLCWLQEQTFILAFIIPAACIIAMNIYIMVRCMIVTGRSRRKKEKNNLYQNIKGFLKSWIILTFLLGMDIFGWRPVHIASPEGCTLRNNPYIGFSYTL